MADVPPKKAQTPYWHLTTDAVITTLHSAPHGLSSTVAEKRLKESGYNEFPRGDSRSVLEIVKDQFASPLVILLIVAAGISWFVGESTDTAVIMTIVILNAGLGFFQDFRAERALEALARYAQPMARVKRDDVWHQIPSRELVVGDVIDVAAGDLVPADCRILRPVALETEEAALTGESTPIEKRSHPVAPDAALGERRSMIYLGSAITRGHGEAIVVATALNTELGQIATLIKGVHRAPTPLQQRLSRVGRDLAIFALVVVSVIFGLGALQGQDLKTLFLTALSLAVAVVPEGLPAVATVSLALGARKMFERHALIRKLPAVETLGSVTVIGSDKTGTLTQNKMEVTDLWTAGSKLHQGPFVRDELSPAELDLLKLGALCNNAVADKLFQDAEVKGEPTEKALFEAPLRLGLDLENLFAKMPRIGEIPFDSRRKRMSTVHSIDGAMPLESIPWTAESLIICKGAIDRVLHACDRWLSPDGEAPLTPEIREKIHQAHDQLAQSGRRVLAVARDLRHAPIAVHSGGSDQIERELVFHGLWGLIDPPRPDAAEAVRRCREAGIRAIMITGDHPETAWAVALELGMGRTGSKVVTGVELDQADDGAWEELVRRTEIYARVSPEHKLRIVETLQQQGEIVAMTGDGVNDAPALKRAQIGVAMGVVGSDVAKESAEMVLLNDSFSTIVAAVTEGRRVYDNIRKFLRYTLTSNMGEIGVMVASPLLGQPLPLTPIQILWTNLVTDGLPGLALALEKGEPGVMKRPPRKATEGILAGGLAFEILWVGLLMAALSWGAGFLSSWDSTEDLSYWRSMIFTVLTLAQLGNAMSIRSDQENFWQFGLFSNPLMTITIVGTFGLQMAILYVPWLQNLLGTKPLELRDLGICCLFGMGVFVASEGKKCFKSFSGKGK